MNIRSREMVVDVKGRIVAMVGLPVVNHRVILRTLEGVQLSDKRTVSDYQITEGSTLQFEPYIVQPLHSHGQPAHPIHYSSNYY